MAHNDNSIISRSKFRRTPLSVTVSEWGENVRDLGLMLAGIYQDLRGDSNETWRNFRDWIKDSLRKSTGSRES